MLEFAGEKEKFDIVINEGENTFVYKFKEVYDIPPYVIIEGIKGIEKQIIDETSYTLIMKDTVGYTGVGHIIKGEGENTRPLKIFRYISRTTNFMRVDYDILGLKKERMFHRGELIMVNYWANWSEDNGYSDLIIRESIIYNRDVNGYITTRDKIITRINEDGTDGYSITTTKKYSMAEATKAGEQARTNIISEMKIATVGLIAQTENITILEAEQLGMPLLLGLAQEIALFIQGARQPIITAINNANYSRLNNDIGGTTIKEYLIYSLSG